MQTIATVVVSLVIVAALIGVAVFLGRGWRKMGTTRPPAHDPASPAETSCTGRLDRLGTDGRAALGGRLSRN